MEDQRICTKFCVKNGFKGAGIFCMLQTAYGDAVMSLRRVFEWYKRFEEGREESRQRGRPFTLTTPKKVDKVLELVREDRQITVREVAEEAGISFGSTQSIMKDILGIYGFDSETTQQASEWRFKNEQRPKKARKAPSKVKVMLTVFFDYQGIVHHEFQQQGSTITPDSYLGVLMRLREAIRQKRPELWRSKSWISTTITRRRTQPSKSRSSYRTTQPLCSPNPPTVPIWYPATFSSLESSKKVKGSEISEHRRDQSGIEEGHEGDPENRLLEIGPSKKTTNPNLHKLNFVSKRPRQDPHDLTIAQSQRRVVIFNADLYLKQLSRVYEVLKTRYSALINRKRVFLQHDNAQAHRARFTTNRIKDLEGIEVLPHPTYSPDIAPYYYALFRSMATFIMGRHFETFQDVKIACRNFFETKPRE
ncbi:hypothetical protein LAZ67_17000089 [Cordylochernes scorpioides]|uniref:Mos1 transposase HTH domain-containing protein n=1 Tax=Cordylochernes scorpioides TaxID=51811 RepID=A0ABY6LF83_9ARAC|nr:hypothetical protein LAZ67_17000089 [Cordylochernes scorpioides]